MAAGLCMVNLVEGFSPPYATFSRVCHGLILNVVF